MKTRQTSQAGFTLIELLVTLALTAAIVTFAFGGINLARRSWAASQSRDLVDTIDSGRVRLQAFVSRTVLASALDEAGGIARLMFDGRSDALDFVMQNEPSALQGGLNRIRLSREQSQSGASSLVLRAGVFRSDQRSIVEAEPVSLLSDVSKLSIRYFGSQEATQAPRWYSSWAGQRGLPELVRFEIAIDGPLISTRLVIPIALRLSEQSP